MKHELALKLKKAGFEFRLVPFSGNPLSYNRGAIKLDGVMYLIPTLSELIDACGRGFYALEQQPLGHYNMSQWQAIQFFPQDGVAITISKQRKIRAFGETYEEAVVNLWLERNKK